MNLMNSYMKHCTCIILFFLFITCSNLLAQKIAWEEVVPGVWKGIAGKPENFDLLKAAGSVPNKIALGKMAATTFPLAQAGINAVIKDGKTYLRFPLQKEEQLYGFGLNFQTVH